MPTQPTDPTEPLSLQRKALVALVVIASVLFMGVLQPVLGAISWALFLAIMFASLQERTVQRLHGRRGWAAFSTLMLVIVIVLVPLAMLSVEITHEATAFISRFKSGEISLADWFQRLLAVLPGWARGWLSRAGIDDLAAIQRKLGEALGRSGEMLTQRVLLISRGTLDFLVNLFVMLYVLYFLLRDGPRLGAGIERTLPLEPAHSRRMLHEFTSVVRATMKGNIAVALVQGALGGLAFWVLDIPGAVLWGAVMAVLSLLPAVGAVMVWGPVAVYLAATGSLWAGIGLAVWGLLVIGLVDNVMRPALVGKETSLPDWVVLVATLGGLTAFGLSGFVIGPVIAAMFIAAWQLLAEMRDRAARR